MSHATVNRELNIVRGCFSRAVECVGRLKRISPPRDFFTSGHRYNRLVLPGDCPLRDDVLANVEAEAPIAQWSRGFLHGHQSLEELWEEYVPEKLEEELDATLMALSFLSSRQMAEAYLAEASTGEQSFQTAAETIHRVLPRAVAQYAGCAFRPFGCGWVLVAHPPSLAVDTST